MCNRFSSTQEVEVMARVGRKWDEDGVPDPEASELGELILKVGTPVRHVGLTWHSCRWVSTVSTVLDDHVA